ncbi:MAG: transporter substrate-binding domain-containing protein [Clostridia bacterium]|nr:transporter substrate-binding domain-containing protein [Clostridia bacterium]
MKKLFTLLMTLILSVTACFGLTACNNSTDIGVGDGKLVIGYTIYPPMNYFDETDNSFVGFDTELAIKVCEILNVEYEFKEIVWNNKVMSLDAKEIDVVWNGMTITEELKQSMSITSPYLENKQVIVCKAEDVAKFSATAEKKGLNASGLEILVETGSAGDKTVKDLGITPTGVSAQKDTLLEVKSGTNKVAVIDKLMADVLVGEGSANPDLTYVDVDFQIEYFGIGCRKKDTATTYAIEMAINQLKEDGTFDTLLTKYFS